MIRLTRNHDPHINPRRLAIFRASKIESSGIKYGVCIYMILCMVDQPEIIIMDLLRLGVRSTGNDLHRVMPSAYILRDLKRESLKKRFSFAA